jgi:hypothetical protein
VHAIASHRLPRAGTRPGPGPPRSVPGYAQVRPGYAQVRPGYAESEGGGRRARGGASVAEMSLLFVLVHAPVLGPASWQPTAAELTRAGHRVVVPSLTDFAAGPPPYAPRLIRLVAEPVGSAAGPADRIVLVLHSGAGPFAAHLAAAVRAAVSPAEAAASVAVVFADAGLPGPDGAAPVVDGAFLPYLRELAVGGVVPPWPDWWPGADPADLFPTPAAHAAVLADARPLSLDFFEETLPPVPPASRLGAAGYLLFSDGYRPEAERARGQGWPVAELAGSHLHPLVRPAEVAAEIIGLARRLDPETASRA